VDVVPRVVVGGAQGGSSGNLMEGLLTILLSERMGALAAAQPGEGTRSAEVEALRNQIRQSLQTSSKLETESSQQGKPGTPPGPKTA
jgi:hypothetical protein